LRSGQRCVLEMNLGPDPRSKTVQRTSGR
jgi:hypothetical protein